MHSILVSNKSKLEALIDFVYKNPHSSFYRTKYGGANVSSLFPFSPDFLPSIPFLTREELVETPLRDRTFVSKKEVRFVAYTSGTTTQKPLITPFTAVDRYYFEPSLGISISNLLVLHAPLLKNLGHTFVQQCAQARMPVTPIVGDPQNLANSAVLARETECDAFFATPTIAAFFHEHAVRHYDPRRFRLLVVASENLTTTRREDLQKKYQNAAIANVYGSSEVGQLILYPCDKIMSSGENAFHILEEALAALELVDGELVVTYGLNRAMPLIRYRTGDYFDVKDGLCACGKKGPVLAWSHREEVDRMRINGVEFHVADADRAFARLTYLANSQYQIHFYPGEEECVRVVIEIEDTRLADTSAHPAFLHKLLLEEIMDTWIIASGVPFRTAVTRGLFEKPGIRFVPHLSVSGAKTKRFINHLS